MTTKEFLKLVVTTEEGYFCLSFKAITGPEWINNWFNWPDDLELILQSAEANKSNYNVYFSSYLFSEKSKEKQFVLPSRTIQADLDEAEISNFSILPTITIETSPGRTQGFWILANQLDLESHEILSRKLTYAIPNSDHTGWPLGHIVRLPNTINHKYLDGPKNTSVYHFTGKEYNSQDIELLPDHSSISAQADTEWLDKELTLPEIGPLELLENIKSKPSFPIKVYQQYDVEQRDRSSALFALLCAAFRAGCTREEVFHLASHSANNKFKNLHYNGNRELAKDILRAEQVVNTKVSNARQAILEARKLSGLQAEKRQYIYKLVLQVMLSEGEFFHAIDDTLWYVRRDSGRPISIIERSNYLENLLDLQFGLNSTEVETAYVIAGLVAYVRSLPINAKVSSLSYYTPENNTVLIHTGRKEVLVVTKDTVVTVTNGSFGILFLWDVSTEVFIPYYNTEPWHEFLFGECFDNLVDISRDDAMALLRTWFFFLLMRNDAVARPILALFG